MGHQPGNRLQKQIDQLRGDISIITEYTKGNATTRIRRKIQTILKRHKITADEQLIACKEDLNQALQAKAQRLRRYTKRSEQYKQNKMFREDSKRFNRELGKKTIQIKKSPDIGEVKKFWQNILEQEVKHNEDAPWIKDQEEELQQINQMEWKDLTAEELRVNMTRTVLYNILLPINCYTGNNITKCHSRSMGDNRDLTEVFHHKFSSLPVIIASDSRYFQSS